MAEWIQAVWSTISGAVSSITNFFSGISDTVNAIVNTGQGIWAGLSSFGAFIAQGFKWVSESFVDAFQKFGEWIWKGLEALGKTFGEWLSTAYTYIANALAVIGNAFYTFGNWIWNGILWLVNNIINALESAWNWLVGVFSAIWQGITDWWSGVVSYINTWFTNIIKTFRAKLKQIIMADIAITMIWKSAERAIMMKSISDLAYGLGGIFIAPVVGAIAGEIIVNLIPEVGTEPMEFIPQMPIFTWTPPTLSVPRPSVPEAPTAPPTGGVPTMGMYKPTHELEASISYEKSYIVGTLTSKAKEYSVSYELSYEVT